MILKDKMIRTCGWFAIVGYLEKGIELIWANLL
jgi:hypothetical protein